MTLLNIFTSSSDLFTWVILPLLIFLSRICDQTIGTLRLIFVSKGFKFLAPVLGFFEVIIWLLAVSQIMKHLDNLLCYIAYGGGFAMGNYIGMYIEEKMSLGIVIIRIIAKEKSQELTEKLRENGYGLTVLNAEGIKSDVKVIFSIFDRKDTRSVVKIIKEVSPHTFYSIEDVKSVNEGFFRKRNHGLLDAITLSAKKSK
ncbi:MAG: DUF2179 domain-containing protein [Bacteroidetes bacterium]|nr:DUF2179 domain-containing protein [Bacteroidota bacterium]